MYRLIHIIQEIRTQCLTEAHNTLYSYRRLVSVKYLLSDGSKFVQYISTTHLACSHVHFRVIRCILLCNLSPRFFILFYFFFFFFWVFVERRERYLFFLTCLFYKSNKTAVKFCFKSIRRYWARCNRMLIRDLWSWNAYIEYWL